MIDAFLSTIYYMELLVLIAFRAPNWYILSGCVRDVCAQNSGLENGTITRGGRTQVGLCFANPPAFAGESEAIAVDPKVDRDPHTP